MNIKQARDRLLSLHRWKHWLLLLAAAVILLLPTVSHARTYCGKLWNTVIEVDDSYLFFTPQYKGVDIWAGEASQNHQKGCDDELLAIVFDVDWPSMQPSQKPWPLGRRNDNIEIGLHLSGSLQGQERDNRNLLHILLSQASRDEWSNQRVEENKVFDEKLDLFAITDLKGNSLKVQSVFWSERIDGSVNEIIACSYLTRNKSQSYCQYRSDLPQYDAGLKIRFLAINLPQWQEMVQKSLQLLESFIQK